MNKERTIILHGMLQLAPFDGWSDESLASAASAVGYDNATLYRAFPGGVVECIDFFMKTADQHMLERANPQTIAQLKIRERISTLIMARLAYYTPHREAVRRVIAWLALPQHAAQAMRILYDTVDAMWYAAGDTSTDYNFYTKRATLAGVYSSTLMVWLNDGSADYADTRAFLERRIANVMQIEALKQNGRKYMQQLLSFFSRAS